MNFSQDNQATLTNLLAALGEGLDPSTGYSMLQQTIGDQQARQDQRTAQMQGYAETVAGQASQGVPYGAARGLMDLITPRQGVPGRVDDMLQSVYPQGTGALPTNANGQVPDFYSNTNNYDPQMQAAGMPSTQAPMGEQAVSPMYTDNPQTQMEMMLNQAQLASAMTPAPPTQGAQDQAALGTLLSAIQNGLHPRNPEDAVAPDVLINQAMADPTYGPLFIQNRNDILMQFPELAQISAEQTVG